MRSAATSYQVTGLTCAHCAQAVTEEIHELAGVEAVDVDLVPGQTSTVTVLSALPLARHAVAAALAEAGAYQLA